jgi:uncharacterized coiled-coil protein SlyX
MFRPGGCNMVQAEDVRGRANKLFCCLLGVLLCLQVVPAAAQSDELAELRRSLAEQKRMLEQQRQQLKELEQRLERLSTQQPGSKPAATAGKEQPSGEQQRAVTAPEAGKPEKQSAQTKPVGKPPEISKKEVEAIASISDEVRGVLTPRGTLVIDPSLKFAHTSNNRVFLEGFGPLVVPSLFLGLIDIREVDRDLWIASLSARYGITSRFQFELKVPYVWREDRIRSRPLLVNLFGDEVFEVDGDGLGDVEFAFDYQLNKGLNGWPFFIGGLRVSAPTGTDPFDVETVDIVVLDNEGNPVNDDDGNPIIQRFPTELATGSGFWGIQPSLTFLYPTDPAVFFGTLSYNWSIEDRVDNEIGEIDPGDTIGLSGGMGFGINERSSFSLGFSYKHVSKTEQNGSELKGSELDIGELSLGYAFRLSRKSNLNLSIGIGATEDAQDFQMTVRLPTNFALF